MRALGVPALTCSLLLAACGGAGGGGTPPTPMPTSTPVPSGDACPASGSLPVSTATGSVTESLRRGIIAAPHAQRYVPGQLAVTYSDERISGAIDREASAMGGVRLSELHYPGRGVQTRVLAIDPSKTEAAITHLRSMRGVSDVARVTYRHRLTITANDPYYVGFTGTSPPYFEAPAIPGQWDMHAIDLGAAWSQFASSPVVGAAIAVVDTGVDVTHPELKTPGGVPGPKIIRTQCFVTFPASSPQTTGVFVTDMDGHGTNVAGIADGDTNNAFAFAGVAFDAPLLAYRIFPTPPNPPSACEGQNPPEQCDASSADEADAINDAVAHGAKVINLSLGAAPPCATNDPEYIAVENAIAHGVVVVAASGNESSAALDCPAQDPGVIAAGASALDDTNPLAISEYVPSYSNWSPSGAQPGGGAYLVAPGGDPSGGTDTDDLHWIEHIYSSTAVQAGDCGTDFANETGNCRILIAGTSMSTPHVAGVASLMLAKNPNLTPGKIALGLCQSADDIGDVKEGCGRVNAAAAVTWAATH